MERSLKSLVKEVYKNSNDDGNFKFVGNEKSRLNTSDSIKVNRNRNGNSTNSEPLNGKSFAKKIKTMKEEISQGSSMNASTIILMTLFVFMCVIAAIAYNYYDEIIQRLKDYFHDNTREKELESELQTVNDNNKSIQGELGNLKKEMEESKKRQDKSKQETPNKKQEKKSYNQLSKKEKKLYSPDQFVKEQGYCYVGEEDNMRHCVEVYNGDVCESGDIFKRIDKCLMPKSFA